MCSLKNQATFISSYTDSADEYKQNLLNFLKIMLEPGCKLSIRGSYLLCFNSTVVVHCEHFSNANTNILTSETVQQGKTTQQLNQI